MIVRDNPSAWQLLFILRGSILPRIGRPLALTVGIAVAATFLHGRLFDTKITLTPIPFSLIGLALAIFLGFRNNATYDRWWEARKLWGELLIRARSLTRQWLCHVTPADDDQHRRQVYRLIAFAHALKHALRGEGTDHTGDFLDEGERSDCIAAANPPDAILHRVGAELAAAVAGDRVNPMLAAAIEDNLNGLAAVQAGCERIRTTPLPFAYTLLLHRTAYLYCLMLPFGLVDSIGYATPVVVGLISYTFFGLDALGDELEEPFGTQVNALALDTLCRRSEIDLRAALDEQDLPAMPKPVDFCLM